MPEFSIASESITKHPAIATVRRSINSSNQPRSCTELLHELKSTSPAQSRALSFGPMDGRDVYNITAPFEFDSKLLLLGRVEPRDTEFSEIIVFEKRSSGQWTPCFRHPAFQGLQDPCMTWAGDQLVIGGVRYPVSFPGGGVGCTMEFFRGSSLNNMRHFLTGPSAMKDIRFKQLSDGRVAVFSRPQGVIGGRGQIGFTIAPSWDAITSQLIADAPLLGGQILASEWGGVNEAHLLGNGQLGLLGHIACFDDDGNRHYYPMAFSLDPETRQHSPIKLIAQRSFFPPGPAKRSDIVDVVFSGGLVRQPNGAAELYAGVSDAFAAMLKLPDPFLEFET